MICMKTEFYDFIKIDKNHKYNHGDFSAANGECLTAEERIEFLKAYSDFLEKKNGYETPEKAVSDEETETVLSVIFGYVTAVGMFSVSTETETVEPL